MFKSPGDIAFQFGLFDIHWYGIIMSFSMLCALFGIIFIKRKFFKEISTDNICDLSFNVILLGLIFARLYYVILDFDYYIQKPFEIIAIWNGGISVQGAIIGGILAGYLYCKEQKVNFFRYADLFVFGGIIGQIIGRWGNFFNSEAFGYPTNLPWKLYIPFKLRPDGFEEYEFFHPTFLYESILNIFVLLILYFLLKKLGEKRKNGIIFCSYLILYSIVRIIVETFRTDSVLNISIFHIAHLMAFALIIFAIILLKKILKTS